MLLKAGEVDPRVDNGAGVSPLISAMRLLFLTKCKIPFAISCPTKITHIRFNCE